MVRGRLIKINNRNVTSADYSDDRARRLIDREFNLSWAGKMRPDNRIVAGRWWPDAPSGTDQFSVENGIAETLGIRLGDKLTYDIAGSVVTATVTSLRKVDWDTFNVNFFVIAPPGLLDNQPVSYITSFYLPPGNVELLNALVRQFSNFLLIDVAQVMAQVQKMMDQVARAVQFVFLFTLLPGWPCCMRRSPAPRTSGFTGRRSCAPSARAAASWSAPIWRSLQSWAPWQG